MPTVVPSTDQKPIRVALCSQCFFCTKLTETGEVEEGQEDPLINDGECAECGEGPVMVGVFQCDGVIKP